MNLFEQPLAIVDVETTGGNPVGNRVIDIAILRIENGKIVRRLNTVVDPDQYIPDQIFALTGISESEIKKAPTFNDISRDVADILNGCVFVAHNARFDYSFIKQELARVGITYTAKCFCTVKLSRKLFPEYQHHDLSSIIERTGITCSSRHRALPDAEVLFDFLGYCIDTCGSELLATAASGVVKTSALPVNLSEDIILALPEGPGVYIFYGEDGDILYIGKSVSIRNRVLSHFRGDFKTGKALRMTQEVRDIEAIETPGELGALLLESHLIKKQQPLYNRVARHARTLIVAEEFLDENTYKRVKLSKADPSALNPSNKILGLFRSQQQAKTTLAAYAEHKQLCPKLLGIENGSGACFYSQLGKCSGACKQIEAAEIHNKRFDEVFAERRIKTWPFNGPVEIQESTPDGAEGVSFVIDNWCLIASIAYDEVGSRPFISGSTGFDHDAYKILARYMMSRKGKGIKEISKTEVKRLLASQE